VKKKNKLFTFNLAFTNFSSKVYFCKSSKLGTKCRKLGMKHNFLVKVWNQEFCFTYCYCYYKGGYYVEAGFIYHYRYFYEVIINNYFESEPVIYYIIIYFFIHFYLTFRSEFIHSTLLKQFFFRTSKL
jgi:hypothetical protein